MHVVSFNGMLFGGKIASYLLAGEWRTRLGGASTHCLEAQQAFGKSIPENVWTEEQKSKAAARLLHWFPWTERLYEGFEVEIQGDRMRIWDSTYKRIDWIAVWQCSQWTVSQKPDEWIRVHGKNRSGAQHIIHIHGTYQGLFWQTSVLKWAKIQETIPFRLWHLSDKLGTPKSNGLRCSSFPWNRLMLV